MRKKILFVSEAFGGGVFIHLTNLSNRLSEFYDIYIAYGLRTQTHENFKEYFDNRVNLIRINNFTTQISLIKDFKAALELRKICKQIAPDIVHLHSSKAGVIGRLALNGNNIPLIYTPHGWSFLKLDDSIVKRYIYKSIEKICTYRKSSIIATSQGEFEEAMKLSKNTYLINNGIDINDLKPYIQANCTPCTTPVIYTLGRICYQKNPILFNKIAERLSQYKFIWIGDGEMRDVLTSENIHISGWGKRAEALAETRGASIFILTSLWEGLPLSLLEAMCLRKVCIVSNVIGNRDVIRPGENGFIALNEDDYIKTITLLIEEKIHYQKIINNASESINNEYNTDVMLQRYIEYYENKIN